jgi:LytR cell envelope-related transcriptional attenuator
LPEIVQEIGAYAGLASVVGLAVLSVLYFSQARDVKRLREWAGRAPERAEQGTAVTQPTPGRVVAQPQPQPQPQPKAQPQAQPKAQPQAQPAKAPAVPAATGARPAAAPAAATPAQGKQAQPAAAPAAAGAAAAAAAKPATATAQGSQQNTPAAPQQQPASATTALKEGAPPPAQPQPAPGSGQPAATPAGAQSAPSGTPPKTGAPAVPGAPRPAAGAAPGGRQGGPPLPPAPGPARPLPGGRPAPQQTQVIPPKRESWHQRIFGSTRNLILAIGGVLLLGAGVALALTQLSGDESEPPPAGQAEQQQPVEENDDGGGGNGEGQRRNRPAIDPSSVTVAVLNGTTVPGLAAQVSDEVQSAGFEVGTVANSSDQQRAESVILFAPGHEREAAAVSRRLDIAQREPIDAATQGLAGDATVVVVTGADRS